MKIKVNYKSYLLEYLIVNSDIPKKKVKEYLKHKNIYVDGVNTTKFDYPLNINSEIIIDTNKNKNTLPFPIIYEDKNIIVVDKPSNILTIATKKEKEKTIYHMVSEYLKTNNKNSKVFIVHRLDKDTSGVLLLAKNERIRDLYQKDWNKLAKREYIAIVNGHLKSKEGRLINNLKENRTNLVYITKEGKLAITNYEVLEESKNYTKLAINIETGRKNQIRVQLSNIKNSIVGDKKYGNKDKEKRLYLHACSLTITNPLDKKIYTYTSKIPKQFNKILKEDK